MQLKDFIFIIVIIIENIQYSSLRRFASWYSWYSIDVKSDSEGDLNLNLAGNETSYVNFWRFECSLREEYEFDLSFFEIRWMSMKLSLSIDEVSIEIY